MKDLVIKENGIPRLLFRVVGGYYGCSWRVCIRQRRRLSVDSELFSDFDGTTSVNWTTVEVESQLYNLDEGDLLRLEKWVKAARKEMEKRRKK